MLDVIRVSLSNSVLSAAFDTARRAAPREACGLLLGSCGCVTKLAVIRNVAGEAHRFELDGLEAAAVERRAWRKGLSLLGYFHSHPAGSTDPSVLDRCSDPFVGVGPRLRMIVTPAGDWRLFFAQADRWERLTPQWASTIAGCLGRGGSAHG